MLKNRFTVHRQHMSLDYNDAPVKADPHLSSVPAERETTTYFHSSDLEEVIVVTDEPKRWIKKLNPSLNRLL